MIKCACMHRTCVRSGRIRKEPALVYTTFEQNEELGDHFVPPPAGEREREKKVRPAKAAFDPSRLTNR